jgi:hypothetical protein
MTPTSCSWQETVLRALVEDVVDHLDSICRAGLDEPHRVGCLVVVYGDAESPDLTFPLEVLYRLQPIPITDPVVLSDVELLHVNGVQPQVGEALLRTLPNVISGERFVRSEHARMTSAGEVLATIDAETRALKDEISAPGVGSKTSL